MRRESTQFSKLLPILGVLGFILIFCFGLYLFLSDKNPLWGNIISLTGLAGLIAFIFLYIIHRKRS